METLKIDIVSITLAKQLCPQCKKSFSVIRGIENDFDLKRKALQGALNFSTECVMNDNQFCPYCGYTMPVAVLNKLDNEL
jgi:ribosomal protein S27AE